MECQTLDSIPLRVLSGAPRLRDNSSIVFPKGFWFSELLWYWIKFDFKHKLADNRIAFDKYLMVCKDLSTQEPSLFKDPTVNADGDTPASIVLNDLFYQYDLI